MQKTGKREFAEVWAIYVKNILPQLLSIAFAPSSLQK